MGDGNYIVKELTYYCRDEERRPIVTVVLLVDTSGNVARGYAVCSDMETPVINSKVWARNGPGLARKRAMKAYKTMKDEFPIERKEPISLLAKAVGGTALLFVSRHCKGNYIASHDGQKHLTAHEQKLLRNNGLK